MKCEKCGVTENVIITPTGSLARFTQICRACFVKLDAATLEYYRSHGFQYPEWPAPDESWDRARQQFLECHAGVLTVAEIMECMRSS